MESAQGYMSPKRISTAADAAEAGRSNLTRQARSRVRPGTTWKGAHNGAERRFAVIARFRRNRGKPFGKECTGLPRPCGARNDCGFVHRGWIAITKR